MGDRISARYYGSSSCLLCGFRLWTNGARELSGDRVTYTQGITFIALGGRTAGRTTEGPDPRVASCNGTLTRASPDSRDDGMHPWALKGEDPIPSHSNCSPDSSRLLATPVYVSSSLLHFRDSGPLDPHVVYFKALISHVQFSSLNLVYFLFPSFSSSDSPEIQITSFIHSHSNFNTRGPLVILSGSFPLSDP